jgi:transcriptional antiterminator RfaH
MPVLREEVTLYPEALLDADGSWETLLGPLDRQWWVLHTRARQEKALARELLRYEIPFYLPLVKKTSVHRGRRIRAFIPLFSGYLFLFGSETERVRTLTTNRIARTLPVHDPDRLQHDLRQVRQLIAADVPLTIESRLSPGDRVRVRFGPLAGIEGDVLARRGGVRLVVSVDFLQQGASVEIDDFMLEPI